MFEINVKADMQAMKKDLQRIKKAIPTITARATNELAVWARTEAIRKAAAEIGQTQSVVKFTVRRDKRTQRFALTKATRGLPIARLRINSEGIQFTDIALGAKNPWNVPGRKHTRRGGGVKLKGGRFQPGAFKGRARGKGKERVWLARSEASPVNPGKKKLGLPRIGLRQRFGEIWQREISGQKGALVFRQRFQRMADYELRKAGFR